MQQHCLLANGSAAAPTRTGWRSLLSSLLKHVMHTTSFCGDPRRCSSDHKSGISGSAQRRSWARPDRLIVGAGRVNFACGGNHRGSLAD